MTLIYVSNFQFDHNEYKQKRKVLTEIAWAPLPWEWDRIAAELCPAAAPHFRFAFFASFELTTSPQNAKKNTIELEDKPTDYKVFIQQIPMSYAFDAPAS